MQYFILYQVITLCLDCILYGTCKFNLKALIVPEHPTSQAVCAACWLKLYQCMNCGHLASIIQDTQQLILQGTSVMRLVHYYSLYSYYPHCVIASLCVSLLPLLCHQHPQVHGPQCTAMAISGCGRYLVTGGNKTLKVWPYSLQPGSKCQVISILVT